VNTACELLNQRCLLRVVALLSDTASDCPTSAALTVGLSLKLDTCDIQSLGFFLGQLDPMCISVSSRQVLSGEYAHLQGAQSRSSRCNLCLEFG